jgi:pyrophosphatase PpaX
MTAPRPALLFDLDGTLIDSIGLLVECMQYAFEPRERRPTVPQWVAGIGTPLRTQLAEWCDSEADIDDMVARYRVYQDQHLERLTAVFPGVPEVLAWARAEGYPTAIVTSKGRGMTDRSLRHVGLAGAFDSIVTYEETTRHKPLPDPVWLACERLGVAPNRALFVGDSPHDMHAGRAAGSRTGAALWGPFSRDELAPAQPDFWMGSLTDLPAIAATL